MKYAVGAALAVAALVLASIFIIAPRLSDDGAASDTPSTTLPTSEVTRIQADRLYERVIAAQERGDTTAANELIPQALQAYALAGDMDSDAMYHATTLFLESGDYQAARDGSEQVLAEMPNNPFALSVAARAARLQGDSAAAQKYYGRFLAVYAAESKRMEYPEQKHHAAALPELKAEAEAYLR
jgi:tetratricopeptide (TPR) repeat protein